VEVALLGLGFAVVEPLLRAGRLRGLDPQEVVEEARQAAAAAKHPANAGKLHDDPMGAVAFRVRTGRWPTRDIVEGPALDAWTVERSHAAAESARHSQERRGEAVWIDANRHAQRRRRDGVAEDAIRQEIASRYGPTIAARMVWFQEASTSP
jgi:hypothetical protein